MPTNINPLYRLHRMLSHAAALASDNQPSYTIWPTIFGIAEVQPPERDYLVIHGLELLFHELQLSRKIMASSDLSASLYSGTLDAVQNAISIHYFTATWGHVRGYLGPQVIAGLQWCSETIPSEESLIAPEDINELIAELEELQNAAKGCALPEPLKVLIFDHVEAIRSALRWYPVTGKKALETAVHKAYGEIQLSTQDIEKDITEPTTRRWMNIWLRVRIFIKYAQRAVDEANRLKALYDLARPWLDYFSGGPPSDGGPGLPPDVV